MIYDLKTAPSCVRWRRLNHNPKRPEIEHIMRAERKEKAAGSGIPAEPLILSRVCGALPGRRYA
jgi:hypothetical protein